MSETTFPTYATISVSKRGKHTTTAQVTVMRKILVIAHELFKTGEKYRKEVPLIEN
jgi:hypothetical protein